MIFHHKLISCYQPKEKKMMYYSSKYLHTLNKSIYLNAYNTMKGVISKHYLLRRISKEIKRLQKIRSFIT